MTKLFFALRLPTRAALARQMTPRKKPFQGRWPITLQGEGFSNDALLSADGKWLAFSSQAANLLLDGVKKQTCTLFGDSEHPYPCYDLFLHNRETGETLWVNKNQ